MSDTGRPAMSARRTKNTGPWPLWGVLTLLLWSTGTLALSPDKKLVDLRHTAWGAKEGAPGISALAQTSDGYLWIRSDSGSLFRFDGLRFEHIELPGDDSLCSKIVYQLLAPNTGGLAHLGVSGWRYLAIDSQCKAVTTHVTVVSQGTVCLTCPDKVFFLPKG